MLVGFDERGQQVMELLWIMIFWPETMVLNASMDVFLINMQLFTLQR